MHMMTRLSAAALIVALVSPLAAQTPRIFVFDQPFWLNLHHYLYVLGRVEAKMPDIKRRAVAAAPADQDAGLAALSEGERQAWRESVSAYAKGLSLKDVVFDDEIVNASNALQKAGNAASVAGLGLDAATTAALDRAAPVYRKAWWAKHESANRARIAELEGLIAQHGPAMLAGVTRVYQEKWPAEGYPVRMAAFSNWAGAYSTRGQLLVMASLDEGSSGPYGLEIAFHEAMHQWDNPMYVRLQAAAKRAQVSRIPDSLSHAMIFYTAGEAARRVMPSHVPYAERGGMWKQGQFAPFRAALDQHWKPYLDGTGSLDAALDALIKAVAP